MTDAIQIVLVDLDNLRRDRPGPLPCPTVGPDEDWNWLESTGEPPAPVEGAPGCVVVFAMNRETAADAAMTFDALDAFAVGLARVLARAELLGPEIAITLPVKQAADKALERLFDCAPLPKHAGSLASVHLLTADRGLKESIGRALGKLYRPAPRSPKEIAASWRLEGKKPHRRKAEKTQDPGVTVLHPARAGDEDVHAIDTPQLAAWAADRPVQIPRGSSFPEIADLVRRRPGVLTQVGLTQHTMRGIVRLGALARGEAPVLGSCRHSDGLELCHADVAAGTYAHPSASPLGPGAIRFASPPCTVETTLPPAAVEAVEGSFEVRRGTKVATQAALEAVSPAGLSRSVSFGVGFKRGGDGGRPALVTMIKSSFGTPLPAWWLQLDGADKTWSDLRMPELDALLPEPLANVRGQLALSSDPASSGLVVRAPFTGTVEVALRKGIGPGTLGLGLIANERVAVLARQDRGDAAGTLPCRAIQEVPRADLRAAYPDLRSHLQNLRRLPIMVPV